MSFESIRKKVMGLTQASWLHRAVRRCSRAAAVAAYFGAIACVPAAAVDLADQPLFSSTNVPGNVALALSVEWPTATTPAYPSNTAYSAKGTYLGYFDPDKCYVYEYNEKKPESSYFRPKNAASAHACKDSSNKLWSGNYLNWASMQTLDAFRWVLTGGYRSTDTVDTTILTKTYAAVDSASVIPDKTLSSSVSGATPFNWEKVSSAVRSLGTAIYVTGSGVFRCTFKTDDKSKVTFSCNSGGSSAVTFASCSAGSSNPNCAADLPASSKLSCSRSGSGPLYTYICSTQNSQQQTVGQCIAMSDKAEASCTASTDGEAAVRDYTGQAGGAADPAAVYRLYINVKVCDKSAGLESNCTQYGSNYKPEGLMQQYASKLRFSAFGYYNDSQQLRDGAVMRSRMKFVGPSKPVAGAPSETNDGAEWDATTGVMLVNPDRDDAAATVRLASAAGWTVNVGNSGVMNYLNKFGYEAKSYKSFDPVSELYYTALRYFKNQGNVPEYTSLSGAGNSQTAAQWLDGFPAITKWDDPVQYSCQKNFILGIGDTFSHRDANLPGSTLVSNREPKPMPSAVAGDKSVDVKKATDMVGQLEGLKGGLTLGDIYGDSSSNVCGTDANMCNTYYIAGLAYDAHTHDIRSDMSGVQTVNTYWMDVIEKQYQHKNQYWLATKYGGFKVPEGFVPYGKDNGPETLKNEAWYTNSDMLAINSSAQRSTLKYSTDDGAKDLRPDNYFAADQPDRMRDGLSTAFAKIASELDEGFGTAFEAPTANTKLTASGYAASYNPKTWTGDVLARKATFSTKSDMPETVQVWSASSELDTTSPATRKIATCCTRDNKGLAFNADVLSSASLNSRTNYASFANVPGVSRTAQSATNFVSYLRGDRTREIGESGGVYRSRAHVLGDIVNSKLVAVGAPSGPYYDNTNPGYVKFMQTYKSRKTVVYAGANDGMLHAFDGTLSKEAGGGKELFAYVPSFVYGDASSAAVSGLASLGNPSFTHHYFVDGQVSVQDVDFKRTGGSSGSGDWRSVLVGGLGKGGKGYFAIDVTDPRAWTNETAVADKVLWEFTDARMGYSYGSAEIFKTRKYGWVVALASGYNNSDGKGYVFLINPKSGELLETIATPDGSQSAPINLRQLNTYIPDPTDYTAESIYAGDLQGNLWRFDLTAKSGSYPTPTKLARLTDPMGGGQPVTTRVRIAVEPNSGKRYVVAGTGRLLADSDISSTQVQTFYAIIDGTETSFYTSESLPKGVRFPIMRKDLAPNPSFMKGIGSAPASSMGWYHDLGKSSKTGVAERITVDPDTNDSIVGAAVNLPEGGDACSPSGSSYDFVVNTASGKTVLIDGTTGNLRETTPISKGMATDAKFMNIGGRIEFVKGDSGGEVHKTPPQSTVTLKRLNWREVLTAD